VPATSHWNGETPAPSVGAARVGGLSVPAKLVLAGEVIGIYARVRWLLRTHDVPATMQRLRAAPSRAARRRARPGPETAEQGRHLAWAAVRVLALLPVDSRCLLQSLVLGRLMTVRGLDYDVVFSVGRDATFEAHCWVETCGVALLEPGGDVHVEIMRL